MQTVSDKHDVIVVGRGQAGQRRQQLWLSRGATSCSSIAFRFSARQDLRR